VIWDAPYQRAAALVSAVASVGVTVVALRRGAFRPRAVVELRTQSTQAEPTVVNVVVAGRRAPAVVRLTYREPGFSIRLPRERGNDPGILRSAQVELPPLAVRELKVWAHRLAAEGGSEGLAADLSIGNGNGRHDIDRRLVDGQLIVPVTGEAMHLEISVSGG
jgi:hypothetical protein